MVLSLTGAKLLNLMFLWLFDGVVVVVVRWCCCCSMVLLLLLFHGVVDVGTDAGVVVGTDAGVVVIAVDNCY
jgi:hypothetical protein